MDHGGEQQRLACRDADEHPADRVVVHEPADEKLRECGGGKGDEGVAAHLRRRPGEIGQAFVEHLGEREGRALEDQAAERRGEEDDREDMDQHGAGRVGFALNRRLCLRDGGGRLDGAAAQEQHPGEADGDGDGAGHEEGGPPADKVDQDAGHQRGQRHAHIAVYSVDRDGDSGAPAPLDHHGEADGVVDRGEHADGQQPRADLERRVGEPGGEGAGPDAEEEDAHHPLAAPLVAEPPGQEREGPERNEAGRPVWDQVVIGQVPGLGQEERRHGGEDQHGEMVEQVPDIQEQELRREAGHGSEVTPVSPCGRSSRPHPGVRCARAPGRGNW